MVEDINRVMKNKTELRRMTDNTMANTKIKEQTVINKTLCRKLQIEQHEPTKTWGGGTQVPP
jgi:hypothetical protein